MSHDPYFVCGVEDKADFEKPYSFHIRAGLYVQCSKPIRVQVTV